MKKNYEILQLDYSATEIDVKNAYRRLAMKYHPDRPNGDELKFKQINKAYSEILNFLEQKKIMQDLNITNIFDSIYQNFEFYFSNENTNEYILRDLDIDFLNIIFHKKNS